MCVRWAIVTLVVYVYDPEPYIAQQRISSLVLCFLGFELGGVIFQFSSFGRNFMYLRNKKTSQ